MTASPESPEPAESPRPAPQLPTIAVVLAGGTGQRVGSQVPKQLLRIAGRPIVAHAVEVFERAPEIDEILLVMAPGYLDEAREIIERSGFRKIRDVIAGGASRPESTARAIAALGPAECNVLFHDAVRPLLDRRIISDCVAALRRWQAVDVVIPCSDTIVVVDGDVITEVPDRARLRRGQTPQGFRLSVIRRAYARAAADPAFTATDDCGVVLRYLPEVPVHVVVGSERNMKVTHPHDIPVAELLHRLSSPEGSPLPGAPG